MKFALVVCALVLMGPYAASAKSEDMDEFKVRQQIRKFNPGISRDRETQIFLLHKLSPDLFKFDKNYDGSISSDELRAAVSDVKNSVNYQIQLNDYRRGVERIPDHPQNAGNESPTSSEPKRETIFILRRKFDEVSSLTFPDQGDDDLPGAQFSYGRDNVSQNSVWTAQGVAAVMFAQNYTTLGDERQRFLSRVSYAVGPYVRFDKLSNSNPDQKKDNLNNLSPGIVGEIVPQNMPIGNATLTNYFRINSGINASFEGVTKSWNIGAEWQPVSNDLGINAPVSLPFFRATVTPTFRLRTIYSGHVGDTAQPIFEHHNSALRLGPTVGLIFAPVALGSYWPTYLQNWSLSASYSVLQDLMSPATYNLFDASLTYFTDKSKAVGFTMTYERGKIDQTGASADTFLAGLSLKLYRELNGTTLH